MTDPFYHPWDYAPCQGGHEVPEGASFSCAECPDVWDLESDCD